MGEDGLEATDNQALSQYLAENGMAERHGEPTANPKHGVRLLDAGAHVCCLYENDIQRAAALRKFIGGGFRCHERVLYICKSPRRSEPASLIDRPKMEIEPISIGDQLIWTTSECDTAMDYDEPVEEILDWLRDQIRQAVDAGYSGLRVMREMSPAEAADTEIDTIIDYEAALDEFLPSAMCTHLCLYDRDAVASGLLVRAGRVHPLLFVDDGFCANLEYDNGGGDGQYSDESKDAVEAMLAHAERHKRAADGLRQRAETLRNILMAAHDLVWEIDLQGKFTEVSPGIRAALGYSPSELIGTSVLDLVHNEQSAAYLRARLERIDSGKNRIEDAEVWFTHKDGHPVCARISDAPVIDASGDVRGYRGVAKDVTGFKRMTQETRKLRAIAENAPVGTVVLQPDSTSIGYVNAAFGNIYGYNTEQLMGTDLLELHGETYHQQLQAILDKIRKTGSCIQEEIWGVRSDGSDFPILVNGVLLDATPLNPACIALTVLDISERKLMERRGARVQKLEAVGELAAGIAHEINTPTQYVSDNLHFLQDAFDDIQRVLDLYKKAVNETGGKIADDVDLEKLQDTIQKVDLPFLLEEIPAAIDQSLNGLERVGDIVGAMKEFSHPGSGEKSPANLNDALKNAVTVSRNEWKYHARIEFDLADQLPDVPCFLDELNQAFLNIIINAAHAISTVVDGEEDEEGIIHISTSVDEDYVQVSIADTGPGIADDIIDRIFDPFFTTKQVGRGTGQGLAVAHNVIVDKHDGTIDVDTQVGEGTTFTIRLPINQKQ